MRDQAWLKLLDLVCHKLGADDARIEIGGRPPDDERLVWAVLEDGRRLVVVFTTPPEHRAEAEVRLAGLLESFRGTLDIPTEPAPRTNTALHRELDQALAGLAERTGAETVWIIDEQSPVLWGASEPHDDDLDVDALVLSARADRFLSTTTKLSWSELLASSVAEAHERVEQSGLSGVALRSVQDELTALRGLAEHGGLSAAGRRLRSARAVVEIRERTARERDLVRTELRGPIQCFAHSIAQQYQLLLVFAETYSPLHAAGNVQRALPYIEHLLLSLPPIDPSAGAAAGAKVIRLPRRS
ncbi:MAG: hypothetical protein JWN48_5307 [Myxococcaceae bacterium]|nr:hypothetical protein [Myxococcaceae bacterium]